MKDVNNKSTEWEKNVSALTVAGRKRRNPELGLAVVMVVGQRKTPVSIYHTNQEGRF